MCINYPIHGGPLDGGERQREKLFPWAPQILPCAFIHDGKHYYEFDTVGEAWIYQGIYLPLKENDE